MVGGRYYAQGGGFAVTDVRGQPFYSAFQRLGGVAQLGYPVSRRFFLDGFTCQAMQVGLLQYLPETGQVVLANTFELLSRFGADDWLFARGIPRPIRDDGSTSFAEAVVIRLGWLTNPAIASAYLAPPPGWIGPWTAQDAINRYGLPMSRPENFGLFTSQRFQRIAFQVWQQSLPGLPVAGTVTPVLGGQLVRDSGILGPLATLPQAPDDDASVPVDLTPPQRDVPDWPARRSGPFAFRATTSATGATFPAVSPTADGPPVTARLVRGPVGQYLVVLVEAQNVSDQPAAVSTLQLQLRDTSGALYQPLSDLSALAGQAVRLPSQGQLAAGASATQAFAFDVPAGSAPWYLEAADQSGSSAAPGLRIELIEPPAGSVPLGNSPPEASLPRVLAPTATPVPTATPTPEPPPPPTRAPTVTPTAEQVLPGILRLRVNEVMRPYASPAGPASAGQEYLAVRVEIENLSRAGLPYGPGFLSVRVRNATVNGQDVGSAEPLGGGTLGVGETVRGVVGFAVPAGTAVTSLVFRVGNNQLEVRLP